MHFADWLIKKEVSDEFIINASAESLVKSITSGILEALNTTGYLEEKIINENLGSFFNKRQNLSDFYRKKRPFRPQLQQKNNEDDEEIEIKPNWEIDGNDDAKPVWQDEDYLETPDLKKIKDTMLLIRWKSMKNREEMIGELSKTQDLNKKIKILKELGYAKDEDRDDLEFIQAAENAAVREDGNSIGENEARLANSVELNKLRADLGKEIKRLIENGTHNPAFKKLAYKYSMDSTDDLVGMSLIKLISVLQNRSVSVNRSLSTFRPKKWTNLTGDIQSFSDYLDEKLTPKISEYLFGMMKRELASETLGPRVSAKKGKRRRRKEDDSLSDDLRNSNSSLSLVRQDLGMSRKAQSRIEFYLNYFNDGQALSFPEETNAAQENKRLRTIIAKTMLELSKENPKDYPLYKPVSEMEIRKSLFNFLQKYSSEASNSRQSIVHASTLEKGKEGGDERTGGIDAIQASYYGSSRRDDGLGASKSPEASQVLIKQEFKNKLKEAINKLYQFKGPRDPLIGKKWALALCFSFNLNCTGGSLSDISSLEKVEAIKVADQLAEILKPDGVEKVTVGNVNTWVMNAKKWIKDNFPELDVLL